MQCYGKALELKVMQAKEVFIHGCLADGTSYFNGS